MRKTKKEIDTNKLEEIVENKKYSCNTPYWIVISLFTSPDQNCVCNLDKYYYRPMLEQNLDSERYLLHVLNWFLEFHKKEPKRNKKKTDEMEYYLGAVYNMDVNIYDVYWWINIPHSKDMSKELMDEIKRKFINPLEKILNKLQIRHHFMY